MEHLSALLIVSWWIASIIDGGVMVLLLVGAATFKPGRIKRHEGVLVCLLLAIIFGAGSLGSSASAYMGGPGFYISYINTNPGVLWPLFIFACARLVHLVVGATFWVWTLLRLRQLRIDAG